MSEILQCDFCKAPINKNEENHVIKIDNFNPLDCCPVCFVSSLILSEQRRVKTLERKKKLGRPKKKVTADPLLPGVEDGQQAASA